ncbi:3760_t:CDS:2 [Racocetra fulgida]|uniref:3760_t:CDS:1 n=1 Tax=Racocetra fulgida TaxID=60492 RepID=A0A9N9FDV1_9GLOM|nr:3760_t:CDS:2 [Racocetra fulgida]
MREYKDSSRERIVRYNCDGKILIKVDIPAKEEAIKEFNFINSSFIPDL